MWRRRETLLSVWESEGRPLLLDQVRDALGHQLKAVQEALRMEDDEGKLPVVERIEFHVPFELLDTPFDQWDMPSGRRTGSVPLGLLHHVVVRCPDERQDARAVWEQKWRWLCAQGGRYSQAIQVITDSHIKRTLGLRLRSRKTPSCVLADISGIHTQSMIDAVLEGGIPAAVWWRGGAPHPKILTPARN
ncbi:hypothetical protein ACQEWB_49790 [Streptomyces sp. CA-249302]|uniref:VMAP-C domain-containing protein n=1 Tax=Streptomyces sp. CA-249302 TaxID=3240058 RepID=UPI003D92E983